MGNSTSFKEIEKKYGQDGIDYVAFRYHQRRNYHKIRDLINTMKDHAHVQKQQVLEFIDQQKRLLQEQFNRAKRQAATYDPDCIKKAQALSKQPVEDFSGYNLEIKRLENLRLDVNTKYQSEKTSMEKRIRYETTKEQNKSHLKGIKEFDEKSDSQRKNIQNQCISLHPQKADQQHLNDFYTKYTWENQRIAFDLIFDKEKEEKEGKSIRSRIRDNVIPSKNPVCC